jgi:hypothetical protein
MMIIFNKFISRRIDSPRKYCNDFEKSRMFSIRVQYSENIYLFEKLLFLETVSNSENILQF